MFSNSTKYAIRTVLHLARTPNRKFTVHELSEELKIPAPFLSKILQQLSRNSVISSVKGRGGGFFLNDENQNLKMIDVIISMEGSDVFDNCILGLPECSGKNPCWMHEDFSDFKKRMEEKLYKFSIKEVIG